MTRAEPPSPSAVESSAPPAPLRTTATVGVVGGASSTMTPASMLAALQPARVFDSGDMIMTAGLLSHPESSLRVSCPTIIRPPDAATRGARLCVLRKILTSRMAPLKA